MSRHRTILPKIRSGLVAFANVLLGVAGLINVGLGTYFMTQSSIQGGLACLGAGVVLFFAASIDRFESLKGLGLEAKTRQLNQQIAQAEITLEKVRALAELAGRATVRTSSQVGRLGVAPSMKEAHALAREVRELLHGLGSTESAIQGAIAPWLAITAFDAVNWLLARLSREVGAALPGPETEFARSLRAMSPSMHQKILRPADGIAVLGEVKALAAQLPDQVAGNVRQSCDEWSARLRYLADHSDLSDTDAWYAIR